MLKEPHHIISEVYSNPLLESSPIHVNYANPDFDLKNVREARDTINAIVQEKRSNLGLANIRELNLLSNQTELLRNEIINDSRWRKELYEIVSVLAPDFSNVDAQTKAEAILMPWWNAAVLAHQSAVYNQAMPELSIDAVVSHSYITQLARSSIMSPQPKTEAMSISNVLITNDDFVVLGLRGGNNCANTFMTVPAGSVEYHTGKNPLFETLYAEHFEETGLSKDEIKSAEFIGRVSDPHGRYTHYISRTHIGLSFGELISLWGSAMDNREHKFLISIKDHPQEAINNIRLHNYRPECANPKSEGSTTLENVNTILPQAAASLLVHYAQREDGQWYKKAEAALNRTYIFRE